MKKYLSHMNAGRIDVSDLYEHFDIEDEGTQKNIVSDMRSALDPGWKHVSVDLCEKSGEDVLVLGYSTQGKNARGNYNVKPLVWKSVDDFREEYL